MNIYFFEEDAQFPKKFDKNTSLNTIDKIIAQESKKNIDYINIILCSDDYLLSINTEYLQHDFYTDIITFDYSETEISSDMYISLDRIIENAKKNSVTLHNELQRIIIHGTLHLVGYHDKTQTEKEEMQRKENEYLQLI
ncbi:MAG: rRNA maturation RNase YbeY [Bacteroidales bacterium]|jgi:probable rRNA maturation factor|nr:rRNA maturation RNase YbeY [Bacteroidales bacterium]